MLSVEDLKGRLAILKKNGRGRESGYEILVRALVSEKKPTFALLDKLSKIDGKKRNTALGGWGQESPCCGSPCGLSLSFKTECKQFTQN